MILEPQAVADLLGGIVMAFNARAAEEGRSYFSKPRAARGSAIRSLPTRLLSAPTRRTRVPGSPWHLACPPVSPPGSNKESCAT